MAIHKHNEWTIHSQGGFITVKQFKAVKYINSERLVHWAFRLKDCKTLCDQRDAGEEIHKIHLESYY